MTKESWKTLVQCQVIRLSKIRTFGRLFELWYEAGTRAFVYYALLLDTLAFTCLVESIYLRRGGGRGEIVPGASDLDFFIVLKCTTPEREARFLSLFWRMHSAIRLFFPFFGETLMGTEEEIHRWIASPTVRSQEAPFSFRLLWGKAIIGQIQKIEPASRRDLYSEALKCYWAVLTPWLKLKRIDQTLSPQSSEAIQLRHGAKAAFDLFRLRIAMNLSPEEQFAIFQKNRAELESVFAAHPFGADTTKIAHLISLSPPSHSHDLAACYLRILIQCYGCLHEMAEALSKDTSEEFWAPWSRPRLDAIVDAENFGTLRDLIAERLVLRHHNLISAALVWPKEDRTILLLTESPGTENLAAFFYDLRQATLSLSQLGVFLPLTEKAYLEARQTSLFDDPFHGFQNHKRITSAEGLIVVQSVDDSDGVRVPFSMLRKSASELAFNQRLLPSDASYLFRFHLPAAIGLRIAAKTNKLAPDLQAMLGDLAQIDPLAYERWTSLLSKCQHTFESRAPQPALRHWLRMFPSLRRELRIASEEIFLETA